MARSLPLDRDNVCAVHEILLSLNLAFAISYGITMRNVLQLAYSKNFSDGYVFLYYFFRAAVRINNFLHLRYSNPAYGRLPNAGSQIGVDLAFAISTIAVALLVLALLHLASRTRQLTAVVNPIVSLLALIALPSVYVYTLGMWQQSSPNPMPAIAASEFFCIGFLFLVYRWHVVSTWVIGFLMFLHYSFWLPSLWRGANAIMYYEVYSPRVFLLIYVVSGFAWMLYLKSSPRAVAPSPQIRGIRWFILASALALVALAVLWLPGKGYRLTEAKERESLTIEMWRTPCQGRCPVYEVTIHGNGEAEYVGEHSVRLRGPEEAILSQEQIHSLLEEFDRADFSRLEDRAFAWGFHTSRVGVRITIDGKTKEVWSDSYYVGSKTGLQAKFVEATAAIDKVVGTDQWVNCDGYRCPD